MTDEKKLDYICIGCDGSITDGYFIVASNQQREQGSETIRLHAENARNTVGLVKAMSDPATCVALYLAKDPANDIVRAQVLPFSQLETTAKQS